MFFYQCVGADVLGFHGSPQWFIRYHGHVPLSVLAMMLLYLDKIVLDIPIKIGILRDKDNHTLFLKVIFRRMCRIEEICYCSLSLILSNA